MMSDLEEELRTALHEAAADVETVGGPPDGLVAQVQRTRARRGRGVVLAALAVVLGAGAIGLVLRPDASTSSTIVAGPDGGDLVLSDPGPARFEMEELPDGPLSAREDMTGVWTGHELIIWGGRSSGANAADGAAYDPSTERWRTIAPSPLSARNRHSAVWTGDEMIVWGGTTQGGGVGGLLDGAAYDPVTDTWRAIADAPAGTDRTQAIGVWAQGRAVIAGGGNSTGSGLDSMLAYDPGTDSWSQRDADGSIVAATAVDGRLAVATIDPQRRSPSTLRVELVDVVGTTTQQLPQLELPYRAASVAAVGLVAADDALVLAVTASHDGGSDSETTVGVLPIGGDRWQAVTTVPEQGFAPGSQLRLEYPPGLTAWADPWLIGGAWEPQAVAVGTPRTVEPLVGAQCGSAGVAVWTGVEVLQWGGQNCRREGPGAQVDDGVAYRVVPQD